MKSLVASSPGDRRWGSTRVSRGILAGFGHAVLVLGLAIASGAAPAPKRPEAVAGPFRVVIERISTSRSLSLGYRQMAEPMDPGQFQQRRTVQLQLAVYARDAVSAAGLTKVEIFGVTAEDGGKTLDIGHYGGKLETSMGNAVLRGYLYAPTLPGAAHEIRSLEGEILAYDQSTPVEVEVPLQQPFRTVERDGVKVTIREVTLNEGTARVVLSAESPADSVLIAPGEDGNHGVRLFDRQDRATALGGGSLLQPRSNRLEYRVTFQGVRVAPHSLRVRVTRQHGKRHVWPFRLERIPLPRRINPG